MLANGDVVNAATLLQQLYTTVREPNPSILEVENMLRTTMFVGDAAGQKPFPAQINRSHETESK